MELVTRGEQERIREAKRISRLGRNLNYENANFITRQREKERKKDRVLWHDRFVRRRTSFARVVPWSKREKERDVFAGSGARLADNSYAAMIYR